MKSNQRKNILSIIIPTLSGGGAEKNAINLANSLIDPKREIHLITFKSINMYKGHLSDQVKYISLNVDKSRYVYFRLSKYIKDYSPSIIISAIRDSTIALVLSNIFPRRNYKLIALEQNTYDGILLYENFFKILLLRIIIKYVYSKCDYVIANSPDTLKSTKKFIRKSNLKYKIIPNPILMNTNEIKISDDPWIKNPSLRVILGVGRLHPQKDFCSLIKAFHILYQNDESLRLIILGEGFLRPELENQIENLSLQAKIKLPGFVSNPFEYMRGANLFCLSSRWEGFGNVVVEAISLGTNVVVTNCPGGPKYIIDNGKYGTLADTANPKSLALAIQEELSFPKSISSIKERGKWFNGNRISKEFCSLIDECLIDK